MASWWLALASAHVLGCGDGDGPARSGSGTDPAAATPDGGDSPSLPPLYAMMIQVYGEDDRDVYVHLTDTLDLPRTLELGKAREFPGVANLAGIGGRLLISSGTEPAITAFDVTPDFQWVERGRISFANFPYQDNANFFHQYILDDQTVYLPWDVTKRLIWDPSKLEIGRVLEDSKVPLRQGGLLAQGGGNRNAIRFRGPVQQPFFYADEPLLQFGPESMVAIYDPATHLEKEVVTLPCPALSMASQDEQGYTYYGSWSFQVRAVFDEGPRPCIARLKPDLTLDTAWTTDLKDMTGGRHHNNFRYVGKGRAIANVLHLENLSVDLRGGYHPDLVEKIEASGTHWRMWLFDLNQREGKPIEGIDLPTGPGAQFAVLDGRTFLFVPYDDWGRSKVYELDDQGKAVERSDTVGDVFKWVRVR